MTQPTIHAVLPVFCSLLIGGCGEQTGNLRIVTPPPTWIEPVVEEHHGIEITDDYRWLEQLDAESTAVRKWTTAQNDWTRSILDQLPGRELLETRIDACMSIDSISPPVVRGVAAFHTERRGSENQPILYARMSPDEDARVLLDPNQLDEEGLVSLDWFVPSHDGSLLAVGLSRAGDEMTTLHLLEVSSGDRVDVSIEGKVQFGGWSPGQDGFLYGVLEDPADPYSRAWCWHEIGTTVDQDPVLFRQDAPSRIPSASLSHDGRWMTTSHFEGWSRQDIHAVNVEEWRRSGTFRQIPIAVGLDARFSAQFVHEDMLYLLTTFGAPGGKLVRVDLADPERHSWRTIIPERLGHVLLGADLAQDRIVVSWEKDAMSLLTMHDTSGRKLGQVALPGPGTAGIHVRRDRDDAFLSYTSFNEPYSIYAVNLLSGSRTLWAQPEVPGYVPAEYDVHQEWCTSRDGTAVPMFIVHRKGLKRDGRNPTLIYGYGGFNISITPRFRATMIPWLEQGGVYASVNLRGGGEFGEAWHRAGMLQHKQNVFDDLYAAAEYLEAAGYTTPAQTAVFGGSNGGLLTGVAAMQRPDLFSCVVSAVPLLDMLRFHHFLMARFWIPEYGDPDAAEDFAWLHTYSPYHNISLNRQYPAMLITAGEHDNRVHPMHARKMVAALQSRAANDPRSAPIMLWIDRDGGHGQGKPRHLRVRDSVDRWAFIMWQTGMVPR